MLTSMTYVARLATAAALPCPKDADLHRERQVRGLTGGLIRVSTYAAETLEGDPAAIAQMLDSLRGHPDIAVLQVLSSKALAERRFDAWSIVYSGHSSYVADHLTRLMDNPPDTRGATNIEALRELILQFARSGGVESGWADTHS